MSDFNGTTVLFGVKTESVAGVAEVLDSQDYYGSAIDVTGAKLAADSSVVGKSANGSLINSAKSYTRTTGGTASLKMEIKNSATPTTKPRYMEIMELAGFTVDVIDVGTNDNYEFRYDGKPSCKTATIETRTLSCGTTEEVKTLRGAVIADAKLTIDGAGSPLIMTGTASGAFSVTKTDTPVVPIEDTNDCVQSTGAICNLGGVLYNVSKIEVSTNLGAVAVTDTSASDGSNLGLYRLADGGDPTVTFSAFPIAATVTDDYDTILASLVSGQLTVANDGFDLIIDDVQFTELTDTDDSIMARDYTCKCGAFRGQLK